jgi:hypothetical protein
MLTYFSLQLRMLNRHLINFGLEPVIGYLLSIAVFIGGSEYLFYKITFAPYLYLLIALSTVLRYSEKERNDFLCFTFPLGKYYLIRIVENSLAVLPFSLFLLYKQFFLAAILLPLLSACFVFINGHAPKAIALPTPFFKKSFEFIIGFRKNVLIFMVCYLLAIIAVIYNNFNLGIFSVGLSFLICFSFYGEPETEFYVWIHKAGPRRFLWNKIRTGFLFSSLICLPTTVLLLFFFTAQYAILLGLLALGYSYLLTIILGKYAVFPNRMNLFQLILLVLCVWFLPLLIGVMLLFYIQSIKRLKEILV